MREILLDGRDFTSRGVAHDLLQARLDLPAYYGRNLDALFDCLTELGEPTHITLTYAEALAEGLGAYGSLLIRVLADAARDNPRLTLDISREEMPGVL